MVNFRIWKYGAFYNHCVALMLNGTNFEVVKGFNVFAEATIFTTIVHTFKD